LLVSKRPPEKRRTRRTEIDIEQLTFLLFQTAAGEQSSFNRPATEGAAVVAALPAVSSSAARY
jgi:hypothetical protein